MKEYVINKEHEASTIRYAPVFGSLYSDIYDIMYKNKDYQTECDELCAIFSRYGDNRVRSILDLGCGTGNHAIPLAKLGYEVTGVDISPTMLSFARTKAEAMPPTSPCPRPSFVEGDIRNLSLGRTFDAIIMMFAVLGYQTTNEDICKALSAVGRHLKKEGLFVFDFWYGPAVLTVKPGDRVLDMVEGETHIIRTASTTTDMLRQLAIVHYRTLKIESGTVSEGEEDHVMRFFFPQELQFFLDTAGFDMVAFFSSGAPYRPPTETDWNVTCVASYRG